jgi:hypothetical protein
MTWGGSGIEKVVFDFICSRVQAGSTVIELGAGYVSTLALSLSYNLYSVEHKAEYINKVEGVNYIYAPEVDGWYDLDVLKEKLPPKDEQKLILIDGLNREKITSHMDLFNPEALFIVHDTYRREEKLLAFDLERILKRKATFHTSGDYWASI